MACKEVCTIYFSVDGPLGATDWSRLMQGVRGLPTSNAGHDHFKSDQVDGAVVFLKAIEGCATVGSGQYGVLLVEHPFGIQVGIFGPIM